MPVQLMRIYFKPTAVVDDNFYKKLHMIFIVYSVLEFEDYIEVIIQRPYNKNRIDVLLKIMENDLPKPLDLNHVLLSLRKKSKINYTKYEKDMLNKIKAN